MGLDCLFTSLARVPEDQEVRRHPVWMECVARFGTRTIVLLEVKSRVKSCKQLQPEETLSVVEFKTTAFVEEEVETQGAELT